MKTLPFPEIYPIIFGAIQPATQVYLVGGCVRDLFLGRTPGDIDLVLTDEVKHVSKRLATFFDGAVFSLDDERQTMRVLLKYENIDLRIDLALIRGEAIEQDLKDRDFTINAMAYHIQSDLSYHLIDPLSGKADLEKEIVTPCTNNSLIDDPIRVIRAERLALQLGFSVAKEVVDQMKEAVKKIGKVSRERQRDEIFKLLDLPHASVALYHYQKYGIFTDLFPSFSPERIKLVERFEDIYPALPKPSLGEFQNAVNRYLKITYTENRTILGLLKASVLTQDPLTALDSLTEGYALSNQERNYLERIQCVKNFFNMILQSEDELSPEEIYRFYRVGEEGGPGCCLLMLAEMYSSQDYQQTVSLTSALFDAYFNQHDRFIDPNPMLNGNDLIRIFHLEPGPFFRELLESLKEAQVAGKVTSPQEAERFIKHLITSRKSS